MWVLRLAMLPSEQSIHIFGCTICDILRGKADAVLVVLQVAPWRAPSELDRGIWRQVCVPRWVILASRSTIVREKGPVVGWSLFFIGRPLLPWVRDVRLDPAVPG
jgi:hypothetical protein